MQAPTSFVSARSSFLLSSEISISMSATLLPDDIFSPGLEGVLAKGGGSGGTSLLDPEEASRTVAEGGAAGGAAAAGMGAAGMVSAGSGAALPSSSSLPCVHHTWSKGNPEHEAINLEQAGRHTPLLLR
jgi:hypothetical protein